MDQALVFLPHSLQMVGFGFLSQFDIYVKYYKFSIGKISKDAFLLNSSNLPLSSLLA